MMMTKNPVKDNERTSKQQYESKTVEVTKTAINKPMSPLVRTHLSQKHSYASASQNGDNIDGAHIDCQPASLAVEAAVAIIINGIHYAVLMASPHQLEYLAVGFLFSEGLIQHSHELLIGRLRADRYRKR